MKIKNTSFIMILITAVFASMAIAQDQVGRTTKRKHPDEKPLTPTATSKKSDESPKAPKGKLTKKAVKDE